MTPDEHKTAQPLASPPGPPDRELLREQILTLGPCIGPYDSPHRCSALHCDHCGICDISEDLLALIAKDRTALLQRVRSAGPKKITEDTKYDPPRNNIVMIYKDGMAARAYNIAIEDFSAVLDNIIGGEDER